MHNTRMFLGVLLVVCCGVAACSDGDSDDGPATPSGESLVGQLITSNTTDSAEPVELNGLALQFSEDEDAFAGFFP